MKNIAIFASGTGTNAGKIIEYFQSNNRIIVKLIVSNRATAPVLDIAKKYCIDTVLIKRQSFYETQEMLKQLERYEVDLIVLAGFMWLVPPYLVAAFRKKIVNIHPALLPKYGGKGMYGMHVHEAVKKAEEAKSGITIHFVNENYDEGASIFQLSCELDTEDSPADIARKVQLLEHRYYAPVIEKILLKNNFKIPINL